MRAALSYAVKPYLHYWGEYTMGVAPYVYSPLGMLRIRSTVCEGATPTVYSPPRTRLPQATACRQAALPRWGNVPLGE